MVADQTDRLFGRGRHKATLRLVNGTLTVFRTAFIGATALVVGVPINPALQKLTRFCDSFRVARSQISLRLEAIEISNENEDPLWVNILLHNSGTGEGTPIGSKEPLAVRLCRVLRQEPQFAKLHLPHGGIILAPKPFVHLNESSE